MKTDDALRIEATNSPNWQLINMVDRPIYVQGYVDGASSKNDQIETLLQNLEDTEIINKSLKDKLDENKILFRDLKDFIDSILTGVDRSNLSNFGQSVLSRLDNQLNKAG